MKICAPWFLGIFGRNFSEGFLNLGVIFRKVPSFWGCLPKKKKFSSTLYFRVIPARVTLISAEKKLKVDRNIPQNF